MSIDRFPFVSRLQPLRMNSKGQWEPISTKELTNPLGWSDWHRLKPLRIDVLSHSARKCGVATNPKELADLLNQIGSELKVPYDVGKRQEEANPGESLKEHALPDVHNSQKIFGETALNAPHKKGVQTC